MLGVGIAEHSGLFAAVLKKVSRGLPVKLLPLFLVFIGIMSSIGTDAGYLILIPLAGLLYAGIILAFMRKYNPQLTFGEMIAMMLPYSIAFMFVWILLLVGFFSFGIPLGF